MSPLPDKHRCLMIGAGGFATHWMRNFLPPFADRLAIVGLVDRDPAALSRGAGILGLTTDQCFTDMAAAFDAVDAECCFIVVTPEAHEEAVMHAVAHNLAILSEKPIADTWDACLRIRDAVAASGTSMEVVQNYRYNVPLQTMRAVLDEGSLGRPNAVIGRFAQDYRELNSWGAPFRHQIPHSLLVEGAVHHFDTIRFLSGADCDTITGWERNPAWSTSAGEFCAMYTMKMSNGTFASYEGNGTAAGRQFGWHNEAYRVECESGAISVGADRVVRTFQHDPRSGLVIHEIPPVAREFVGHGWLINEFLEWLEGSPAPATEIERNLRSVAMVFGAIEASRNGQTVDVAAMIPDTPREREEHA